MAEAWLGTQGLLVFSVLISFMKEAFLCNIEV
jgi:hypothetical protein